MKVMRLIAAGLVLALLGGLSAGAQAQRPKVGGNVTAPIPRFKANPAYPREAIGKGIQGEVVLEVAIGTDGSVVDVRVSRSIPELD